jgi:hypothetical protein
MIGSGNTAIGCAALQGQSFAAASTNGFDNTAIGAFSLWYAFNVETNIAIGYEAGGSLLEGTNNIYIGNEGSDSGYESGVTYIGTTGVQSNTYVAGQVTLDHGLNIDVQGTYGQNIGNVYSNALTFGTGPGGSGEGIASARVGANPFDLEFYTGFDNRMTILSGGNVGIGTTSPDALLSVNGTADKPGGGSWGTFSDARLKDVGAKFTYGLAALEEIQPVHYHYKEGNPLHLPSQPEYVGVLAQDVQSAVPEAVQRNKDGYLVLNNDPIIWTMLNAIKELNRKRESEAKEKDREIHALREQNDSLAARLTELEATVKALAEKK